MSEEQGSSAEYSELAQLYRVPPDRLRAVFRLFNRFMVAMFRLGLGPYISGPYTGYVMVLTTIGRKTGLPRRTPVNYVAGEDEVYCLLAFGPVSDWYKNLRANPDVHVWVGRQAWAGQAEVITDPAQWIAIFRRIASSAGFADWTFTKTPLSKLSDETLLKLAAETSILRIRLDRKLPRSEGPGDLVWLWPVLGATFLAGCLIGRKRGGKEGDASAVQPFDEPLEVAALMAGLESPGATPPCGLP